MKVAHQKVEVAGENHCQLVVAAGAGVAVAVAAFVLIDMVSMTVAAVAAEGAKLPSVAVVVVAVGLDFAKVLLSGTVPEKHVLGLSRQLHATGKMASQPMLLPLVASNMLQFSSRVICFRCPSQHSVERVVCLPLKAQHRVRRKMHDE